MVKRNEARGHANNTLASKTNLTGSEHKANAITLSNNKVYDTARAYVDAGLSVIPIRLDGSKTPAVKWKRYQTELPTDDDLASWFNPYGESKYGIGIVC